MATDGRPSQPQVIERTGIALVHEGERIFPAEGSAAELGPAGSHVVNYYFPVEIEVVDAGAGGELTEAIYDALQRELSALG